MIICEPVTPESSTSVNDMYMYSMRPFNMSEFACDAYGYRSADSPAERSSTRRSAAIAFVTAI
jgi:hypothetical protein